MAISGIGQNYYRNNVETKGNTKNVTGTEKAAKAGKERNGLAKAWSGCSQILKAGNYREEIIEKMKHTVMQSAASFSDTRAEILKGVREEKGQYGYSDIVNACGLSYAKLYAEIEKRHDNEQKRYYNADGTLLTKEDEMEWLDMQYGQEVEWQKSCARIAAQGQAYQGKIPEMPTEKIEELEDAFYQARDAYMKLYHESRQDGRPLALQNFAFGSSRMYEA